MRTWVLPQQRWGRRGCGAAGVQAEGWEEGFLSDVTRSMLCSSQAASWAGLPLGLNVQGKGHKVRNRAQTGQAWQPWRAGLAQGVGAAPGSTAGGQNRLALELWAWIPPTSLHQGKSRRPPDAVALPETGGVRPRVNVRITWI